MREGCEGIREPGSETGELDVDAHMVCGWNTPWADVGYSQTTDWQPAAQRD
jgi:hypothetical protein